MAELEHINLTVTDVMETAAFLNAVFDWKIRWQGKTSNGEWDSVHVGSEGRYLALFSPGDTVGGPPKKYTRTGTLNHIGVVVDDLEATEAKVRAAGCTPHAHFDYEPGKRFYFDGPDGVEYEVVSYA
ncbi:VOC family protein [Roseobacteraceae bacterium S113]